MDDGDTYRMEITANSDGTAKVVESNSRGTWTSNYYYANTISEGVLWAFEDEDNKGNMVIKSRDLIDNGWKLQRVQ